MQYFSYTNIKNVKITQHVYLKFLNLTYEIKPYYPIIASEVYSVHEL